MTKTMNYCYEIGINFLDVRTSSLLTHASSNSWKIESGVCVFFFLFEVRMRRELENANSSPTKTNIISSFFNSSYRERGKKKFGWIFFFFFLCCLCLCLYLNSRRLLWYNSSAYIFIIFIV
jgi:hypothetical protein